MKNVSIIGDGGWGTALAIVLHQSGHTVRVWGPFPDYIAEIQDRQENTKFLRGVPLPPGIVFSSSREEAADGADVVVLATPSRFFEDVAKSFAKYIPSRCLVVSVAKGLHEQTYQRMTEVAARVLARKPIAALSGPSHAEEVARGVPTAVVVACEDHGLAEQLQALFTTPQFRVYTSDDVLGVELGGALKNIIALAAGVCDGIGFGDNTKAALITRGLAEMTRLGCAMGAHPVTFSGLSGMGDLIVTCESKLSRNRSVGERLGRGERIQDILDSMDQVAEGVWTCAAAQALAEAVGVEVPITREVSAVIHDGKDPREAVQTLLGRDLRPERD